MPIDNLSTVYTPKDTGSGQNVYGGLSQVFKPQKQTELDFTPLLLDKQAKDEEEKNNAQEINDLFNPKLEATWLVERERLDKEYADILKEATELQDKGVLNGSNLQRMKSDLERNNLNRKSSMTNYNASKKYRDFINQNADKIDYEAAKQNVNKFDFPMNFPEIAEEIKEKYKGNTSLWRANNMGLLDVSPKETPFDYNKYFSPLVDDFVKELGGSSYKDKQGNWVNVSRRGSTKKDKDAKISNLYKSDPTFKAAIDKDFERDNKGYTNPEEYAKDVWGYKFDVESKSGTRESTEAKLKAKAAAKPKPFVLTEKEYTHSGYKTGGGTRVKLREGASFGKNLNVTLDNVILKNADGTDFKGGGANSSFSLGYMGKPLVSKNAQTITLPEKTTIEGKEYPKGYKFKIKKNGSIPEDLEKYAKEDSYFESGDWYVYGTAYNKAELDKYKSEVAVDRDDNKVSETIGDEVVEYELKTDGDGNEYVVDKYNEKLKVVTIEGVDYIVPEEKVASISKDSRVKYGDVKDKLEIVAPGLNKSLMERNKKLKAKNKNTNSNTGGAY